MGWSFKRIEHDEDLARDGVPGKATIQSLKLIHRGEFSLGKKKALAVLSGAGTMTVIKTELRVEIPGREPYTVKRKLPVPMMRFGRLGVGAVLPVLVDPGDAERLEVQWDRTDEFVYPTLEQHAATNPYVAAALAGLEQEGIRIPPPGGAPGIVIDADDVGSPPPEQPG